MVNAASRWSAREYARTGAFVPALGAAALNLLDPRPGELILDVGCGDGVLTEKIAEAGARVIGVDSSAEMIEAARVRGIDAFVADAEALGSDQQVARFGRFDAAFSNAALHWMLDPHAVATGIYALLNSGGRFVGEMGGAGNIATLRAGIRSELAERGYPLPAEDPQWYPTIEEFTSIYRRAGFTDVEARLVDRPTDLAGGIQGWLRAFRSGLFDVAMVPESERDEIGAAIERRLAPSLRRADGSYFADYVRLRFSMRKPV